MKLRGPIVSTNECSFLCFTVFVILFVLHCLTALSHIKGGVNTPYLINNAVNLSIIYIYSLNTAAIYIVRKMYTLNTFISVPF